MENLYLCSDSGFRFYVSGNSLDEVREIASRNGVEVILDEPLPENYLAINPASLNVVDGKLFKAVGKIN
jgi:hypothetical protein